MHNKFLFSLLSPRALFFCGHSPAMKNRHFRKSIILSNTAIILYYIKYPTLNYVQSIL